jgi:hypothetical protein
MTVWGLVGAGAPIANVFSLGGAGTFFQLAKNVLSLGQRIITWRKTFFRLANVFSLGEKRIFTWRKTFFHLEFTYFRLAKNVFSLGGRSSIFNEKVLYREAVLHNMKT